MNRYSKNEMRSSAQNTVACLVLALALVASASYANWEPRLHAEIPFPFVVGETTLPAGEYVLSTSPAEPNALRIYRTDGDAGLLTLTQEIADSDVPANTLPGLTFEKLEGKRFLEEIHIPSGGWHWKLDKGTEYLGLKAGGREGERETIAPKASG